MEDSILYRLQRLRAWMRAENVMACVIPQTDAHQSEYVDECDRLRAYFSGFSGSAGLLVVAASQAALWTDSRYYIQAEEQLRGTGIVLQRKGLPDTPDTIEWLKQQVGEGSRVAANPYRFTQKEWRQWQDCFEMCALASYEDLWINRPQPSQAKAWLFDLCYTGESRASKIKRLREAMESCGADVCLFSKLDEIAWLLNVRGGDVESVLVVRSYLWVEKNRVLWMLDQDKVDAQTQSQLAADGVGLCAYNDLEKTIGQLALEKQVWIDKQSLNAAVYQLLLKHSIIHQPMPVTRWKAIKNSVEIAGFRRAMLYDGVVWVRFLRWLEDGLKQARPLSELKVAAYLLEQKRSMPSFVEESFATIAGYGAHAAIVHYSANEQTDVLLERKGLLLVDTGTHYIEGTTDATRTVVCGPLSDEEKKAYTLVLKGHIALAMACFPLGTNGAQLDVLAKQYLWGEGLSFGHGTGHGIGHLTSVHEPYAGVHPKAYNPLECGMVLSNEPGYYKEGCFGVRLENALTVVPGGSGYAHFETLTLIPFDLRAINPSMLSQAERWWLNAYHARVREELGSLLSEEEKLWLNKVTYDV